VLAGDVIAPVDLPPWDNSAMDGFAVRSHEAIRGASLEVGETIAARGRRAECARGGRWMRIMTGRSPPRRCRLDRHDRGHLDRSIRACGSASTSRAGEHVRRRG
jgi:molybdopterin molybdotransferase